MKDLQTILNVAMHYAKLGWSLTPGHHTPDGKCGKHPTVPWNQQSVRNGHAIGPTTNPAHLRSYFLEDGRCAEICVHAKQSRLVVVDCDRKWRDIIEIVDGKRVIKRVFVDGVENFLKFMGGDPGTKLISRTNRGLHFLYLVDSEEAARIVNGTNVLGLPGVDVRGGGSSSGGVTVEFNGVCPGRGWVRGTPRIEKTTEHPEGVIAGVEDYENLRFDDEGNCTAGLPLAVTGALSGRPRARDLCPVPEKLLRALLARSHSKEAKDAVLRQANAARESRRLILQDSQSEKPTKEPSVCEVETAPAVPFTPSTLALPLQLDRKCTCGKCKQFEEAKELLAWIPPEVDYEAWRNTIWGVSDLLGNASCGADLVAGWSGASLFESRRDPDQARRIYKSDRHAMRELLTDDANIDETFLRCMATLCGGPFSAVMNGSLRHIAQRHLHTLLVECGVDVDSVLLRELEKVFGSPNEPGTLPTEATAPTPASKLTPGAPRYRSLGTAWGPLCPGILDELLPP
ncbi:MAG: bifunctional DNA primase/polymerase, partial [Planctomycetes bacterium]|nr:bifunctional DNA primase/polymerase [Planctomycetota bacterium]